MRLLSTWIDLSAFKQCSFRQSRRNLPDQKKESRTTPLSFEIRFAAGYFAKHATAGTLKSVKSSQYGRNIIRSRQIADTPAINAIQPGHIGHATRFTDCCLRWNMEQCPSSNIVHRSNKRLHRRRVKHLHQAFGSRLTDHSWSFSDIPSRRREIITDRSIALPPLKHSLFWRREKEPRAEGEKRGR